MSARTASPTPFPAARLLLFVVAAGALFLPGCDWDGQFTVLGYTTAPQYDRSIHTVYVPIFKNLTFWKRMEFELTRQVIREIETKTPYKVVSDRSKADTELLGTIISYNKNVINRNQLNEIREAETTLAVEVVWRDLRTGEILSRPQRGANPPAIPPMAPPIAEPGLQGAVAMPGAPTPGVPVPPPPGGPPVPGGPPGPPPPVLVQSIGGYIPELGPSTLTAQSQNINRLAVQIVSMMEKPW